MKILLQDNIGSHYRKAIFMLIDKELHCDFCFGDNWGSIKKIDYKLLNGKVTELRNVKVHNGYYQQGMMRMMRADYDTYILCGDLRCLSVWTALLYGRFCHKKNIYIWTHGWYGEESWLQKIFKKAFLRLPTGGVFLYGNYARELMIKEGFNPERLFVIHNSLDYDRQLTLRSELTDEPIYENYFGNHYSNLFFVGRLTKVKQLDMILRAMAQLRDKGEYYNMTFIGEGEVRHELESLVHQLKLDKQVWFYGACYEEKVLGKMIYNADLCVAPGNIGLTAMHALVFGTPAITHNDFSHQMPEFEAIQEGVTGTFFTRNDVNSLAENISLWFKKKKGKRGEVRQACMKEIDLSWTPNYQLKVIKEGLKIQKYHKK